MHFVLCCCGTWSFTLREEHSIVFESRVMKHVGPTMAVLIGGWRKLHNEGLYYLYSVPDTIRVFKEGE